MNVLSKIDYIGTEPSENPYIPYIAALEKGIIANPEELAENLRDSPGVYISNGFIPNNKGAGIINIGNELGAFDLSSLEFNGSKIEIKASPKSAVDHDSGRITDEGAVVLELPDGRLKIVGLAIDTVRKHWLARDLLADRWKFIKHRVAVVALDSFDIPEYEVVDVNSKTGTLSAQERTKHY